MVELVVLISLVGIAVGRLPVLRMNRASIALVGAILVILLGGLPINEAFASLDMNTLALLFAVMVLNVNLAYSGFFRYIGFKLTTYARTPRQLLGLVILASGALSALFLNDTIVLMLTPLLIETCRARNLDAVPFLIALALSANIGSMATIIGNPQNILIGASSGIPFATFTGHLIVPAVIGLGIAWIVVVVAFRKEVPAGGFSAPPPLKPKVYRPLLVKSIASAIVMLAGIIVGLPIALAALTAAAVLLITRRIKPERVFGDVDWSLLVFFSGLFMLTESVRLAPHYRAVMAVVEHSMVNNIPLFTLASVVMSNLISNVPTVMLVRPLISTLSSPGLWWLLLAMATTLAGNLTLLGSVANLIVAESAKKRGVFVTFGLYLRAGLPVTLLTTLVGALWLAFVGGPG